MIGLFNDAYSKIIADVWIHVNYRI